MNIRIGVLRAVFPDLEEQATFLRNLGNRPQGPRSDWLRTSFPETGRRDPSV